MEGGMTESHTSELQLADQVHAKVVQVQYFSSYLYVVMQLHTVILKGLEQNTSYAKIDIRAINADGMAGQSTPKISTASTTASLYIDQLRSELLRAEREESSFFDSTLYAGIPQRYRRSDFIAKTKGDIAALEINVRLMMLSQCLN